METFNFSTKVFKWSSEKSAWYFISLPEPLSRDIDNLFGHEKKGWGSLPVKIRIGSSEWQTSIFPDKKSGCYILPIKADIRKRESIKDGDEVAVELRVNV